MNSNEGRCNVMEKNCESIIAECDRERVFLDPEWVELLLIAKNMGMQKEEIRSFLKESKTFNSSRE